MTLLLVGCNIHTVQGTTTSNLIYIYIRLVIQRLIGKIIHKAPNRLFKIQVPAFEIYRPASPDKWVEIGL
jgi:hypothetical protein